MTLAPDTASLRVGSQLVLIASARTSAGVDLGNVNFNWTSSDSAIAAVSQTGTVTARRYGPAIVTAATGGVTGVVHIQVLAAARDSAIISATDTTRVIVGQGSAVIVAPQSNYSGQRLVVEEVAPPAGTSNPLGFALRVSFVGSLARLRASVSGSTPGLALTVSSVTSIPSGSVAAGESRVAFLLSGGATSTTSANPVLRVSDREVTSTSGTGAATLTSYMRVSTAGSTPMLIVATSAPPPCSQLEFPDGERLYRIRTAPASIGPAPFALVLVHGWQFDQTTCESAAAWRPADATWSTFLARFFPSNGSQGEDKRLQLFDVWIAHYPSHRSIQSNGDNLARLIAQQIPNKRIAVLAHSMGGLVTAAALRNSPGLAIDTIVALGTPWRGSPIPGGWWIMESGSVCASPVGGLFGVALKVATRTEGARDLSDASDGYLQGTLLSTINSLAPRITAIGGNIRNAHLNPTDDLQYRFYSFGDCVLKDVGYDASDGIVPSTSVTAEGQIGDATIVSGLDHSQLYAVAGQADPLRIAADRFVSYLSRRASVATVTITPGSASISVGTSQQFTAAIKDATGSTLTNRAVAWSSSNDNVVTVNSAGLVTAGASEGTVTITAQSEGKWATATVSVISAQRGVDAPPRTRLRVAVFAVDFSDTPADARAARPTVAAMRDAIFNGRVAAFYRDMSFGQFTMTGDVFGYFRHQLPEIVNGVPLTCNQIESINNITIPGFDPSQYDVIALLPFVSPDGSWCGWATSYNFSVNGIPLNGKPGVSVSPKVGYPRSPDWSHTFQNTFADQFGGGFFQALGGSAFQMVTQSHPFTGMEYALVHELGHTLGMGHANSRTNGDHYDYEPEVGGNQCGACVGPGFSSWGDFLTLEYGNYFDVMGSGNYGSSLNMLSRDQLGWLNATNRYSVKNYGHFSTTLFPVNAPSGIRALEVRIPYQYSTRGKNHGYFLEVRSASSTWDVMSTTMKYQDNYDGILVIKDMGAESGAQGFVLDMSPSPNLPGINGFVYADFRSMVLKPGMTYANSEIRLSNVRKNGDGSFSVEVDVLKP